MDQDAIAKKLGYLMLNAWALQEENEALKKLIPSPPAQPTPEAPKV